MRRAKVFRSIPTPLPRGSRRLGAAVAALVAALGLATVTAPSAEAGPTYQAYDADNDPYNGIYLRNGTSMGNVSRTPSNYITYGTSLDLMCGTWGESVGPYGNRRWHNVRVLNGSNAGRVGWIADRYVNTPNRANQPTPGEPECGSGPAPAPQPSPQVYPESWVGSPVNGVYDQGEPSPPSVHHFLGGNPEHDFSVDIGANAGVPVKVFVAPQNSGYSITTRVDRIGAACGNAARGGNFVTVGVYANGVRTGSVTYGHVRPTVRVGDSINRYGGQVGTVAGGLPRDRACWTGSHVHTELWTTKPYYSCYARIPHERSMRESNWIGFVGGTRARGIRQACP